MPRPRVTSAEEPTAGAYRARVPGVAYGLLDTLLGYQLRRAQLRLYEDFERAVGDAGITPQRFAALVLIDANPGIGQARLAEVMGIARTGAKALADRLMAQGWVSRTANRPDKRQRGLTLTAPGRAMLDRTAAAVIAHDRRMAAHLPPADRARLTTLLLRLAEADGADDVGAAGAPTDQAGPPKLKP